ncbi:MAG: SRPBCC family protein [Elusimicrobia bacterium]|nr:SRPBCC family protein [Elusimicrobiota bacterium]
MGDDRAAVRGLRRGAAALAALLALAAAARAAAPPDPVQLRLVRRADRQYEVQGLFFVPASTATAWDVLTDYERIPRFVPAMRQSRVVGAAPDGAELVEQVAIGRALFLRKSARVLLEVRRDGDRLDFRDVSREDFDDYRGRWEVQNTVAGSLVVYRLVADPKFFAPSFLMRGALRRSARDLLARVRAEILRRARGKVLAQGPVPAMDAPPR